MDGSQAEWINAPDGKRYRIDTVSEYGAVALANKSAYQVLHGRKTLGWARDDAELTALLDRVRTAISTGWVPEAGRLPDE